MGTWAVAASGVSCQAASDVLNQYENASLRADGTSQPLGPWSCRLTKFVAFQADTNNGYEAWRCSQGPDWVTFATGKPALANKPGANPPTGAPAGFSSNGQGPAGSVAGGSYSGIAEVGSWGPVPDRASCPQGNGFTVDIGRSEHRVPVWRCDLPGREGSPRSHGYVPGQGSAGSYAATCQGGGNAGVDHRTAVRTRMRRLSTEAVRRHQRAVVNTWHAASSGQPALRAEVDPRAPNVEVGESVWDVLATT